MRACVSGSGGRPAGRGGLAGLREARPVEGPALGVVATQALRPAPDGVFAAELAPHQDPQAGAAPPPRLLGELQGDALEGDDIVPADEALGVLGEALIEVHDVAQRDEGAGGVAGGRVNWTW